MATIGRPLMQLTRNFSTTVARRSQGWQQHGLPGTNMPFDINNRYKLTAMFVVYFASGFGAPFFLVRHQLLKD